MFVGSLLGYSMMGDTNQVSALLQMLSAALDENAEELAEAQYKYFEELQEAGFTEDQAMELIQDLSVNE